MGYLIFGHASRDHKLPRNRARGQLYFWYEDVPNFNRRIGRFSATWWPHAWRSAGDLCAGMRRWV